MPTEDEQFDALLKATLQEESFRATARFYAAMFEELLKTSQITAPIARDITVAHIEALGVMSNGEGR